METNLINKVENLEQELTTVKEDLHQARVKAASMELALRESLEREKRAQRVIAQREKRIDELFRMARNKNATTEMRDSECVENSPDYKPINAKALSKQMREMINKRVSTLIP